ncbi:MAG: hypothetical protein COU90_01365 [Candidatus Ryanbacteria bacterium CG10_big_fil_rev_8_21_14_0_10_43_42]|uniref:histidine kinase n=1 Tax=Candidatus Ryanbacteria bacterium CG10_big_fil_rev_8_21_14_0_10_43_42 TaxID=1974864 RepID=A0A2M8KXR5_9BACT|nr:MAG: hypothetical protein COU90_01365 [Candidatus Ryanbacteria bacterium CG10_big_fil_rev_8_21_14_0_10_43_42]
MTIHNIFRELNISEQCARYHVVLWACPHFLFIIMGIVIICAILGTFIAAERYATPEITLIVVPGVTAVLFALSHIIIRSFEQMAEAARAKAEFVSIASHQLRSPLTSVKWQLEVLLEEKNYLPEVREQLEMINNQNDVMLRLVNDLLAVSRIDNDQLSLTLKPLSIADLTADIVTAYRDAATKSEITLAIEDIPSDLPLTMGDAIYTRWVVQNLVDNAIRYSYPGTTATISLRKEKKYVRWSITNKGISIPYEDQGRIFEKFFRARTSIKWQTEGSGLGLYVAKAIVTGAGGSMGFTSAEDKHTTFWFTLPITPKKTLLHADSTKTDSSQVPSKVTKRDVTI